METFCSHRRDISTSSEKQAATFSRNADSSERWLDVASVETRLYVIRHVTAVQHQVVA